MPVRSIKLKLVVPRGKGRRDFPQTIWTTHRAVNEAVIYYERCLLLLRGREYMDEQEETVAGKEVREKLLHLARSAQKRNGSGNKGADKKLGSAPKIIEDCRCLYEEIVPSAIGKKGTAQGAGQNLGALTDPESQAHQHDFVIVSRPRPKWLSEVEAGSDEELDAANKWLSSDEAKPWLHEPGRPTKWVLLARKKDPKWPKAFRDFIDKKEKEVEGAPTLVRDLKSLGVLPIIKPYLAPRIAGSKSALNPWDRVAFRLAVEHLLSWESWCLRADKEHKKRKNRLEEFQDRYKAGSWPAALAALRKYETQRNKELEDNPLKKDRDFVITRRMVRGWDDLKERLAKDKSEAALVEIIAREQTRLRGRFGDHHLYRWLAHPRNHHLWQGKEEDPVDVLARLNAMQLLVDRSRKTARMTLPEPRLHPRAAEWGAEGSTASIRKYKLDKTPDGGLCVSLPMLKSVGNDKFEEIDLKFALAPSGQFLKPTLDKDKKTVKVGFESASGEEFSGKLGGTNLIFKRAHLRNQEIDIIESGNIGPAYLKLAIDIDLVLPDGKDDERLESVRGQLNHFNTSLSPKSKSDSEVRPGLRLLSVDLGVRRFAACSVFELKKQTPKEQTPSGLVFDIDFDIDGHNLRACHERSFVLDLPGERQGARGEEWRKDARDELHRLRQGVGRYKSLYRAVRAEGMPREERVSFLDELEERQGEGGFGFEEKLTERLRGHVNSPPPVWDKEVAAEMQTFRAEFGPIVKEWRRRTRSRARSQETRKFVGKSMWAITHLTDTRKFLQRWSLLGRKTGEIRRADRDKTGVFAENLLSHINGLKDDRIKTGSDLIVQAARGLIRDGTGKWAQHYDPCDAILFEDLSRYRMRTDRPRKENSMLMKWAHRAIPREVAMQGEVYGLSHPKSKSEDKVACESTGAAFSSRYHAGSRTPGIRCHILTSEDMKSEFFKDLFKRENPKLDLEEFKGGDLVPISGGEIFVWVDGKNGKNIGRIHADINAAQNLQRRFWTRHSDAFRLPCTMVAIGGKNTWVPIWIGKRLLGGLGGHGYLVPTGHKSGSFRWEETTENKWRKLSGEKAEEENTQDPDLEEQIALEEETLERTGEREVFFQDPSGNVLPSKRWYPTKKFWSITKDKTVKGLKGLNI